MTAAMHQPTVKVSVNLLKTSSFVFYIYCIYIEKSESVSKVSMLFPVWENNIFHATMNRMEFEEQMIVAS